MASCSTNLLSTKKASGGGFKEKFLRELFLIVLICLQRILLPHRFLCITGISDSKKEITSVSIENSLRINDNDFHISFLSGRTWPNGRLFLKTIR